ncbi:MAG: hypothetical protein ACK4N5_12845, partial [Myxococcales bacterium]
MGFRTRILGVLAVVAVAPALLLGWLSWSTSRRELTTLVGRMQVETARELADSVDRTVADAASHLKLSVHYLPLEQLSQA